MAISFIPIPNLHIADYVVMVIFLCICMGIGIYYGYTTSKNPTLENYFFGNRRLLILPVAMSLFVTFTSAISIMGQPAEVYVYGIRVVYGGVVPYILSMLIANVTVVPLLFPLKLISTYEYLQLRFKSKGVRTMGTVMGMFQTIMFMGVALYAPGLALQIVAGIPLWVSLAVVGLVGTIYTTIGGIKSVVWTDAFQFIVMFVGLAAVIIQGNILIGTRHSVFGIAAEGRRLEFFNFDLDPRVRHTNWGLWLGMTFGILPNWCTQACLQRISSLRSLKSAYVALCSICFVVTAFFVMLGYLGILVYSHYNVLGCDPVEGGFISNFNQLVPFYVLDVLRTLPGLSGIFISCLFSGALSTFSSGINSVAANTVEDILGDCVKNSKMISQTLAAKLFVISYGLAVIGLAYGINYMSGSVVQMTGVVFGACGGPLAGLFFLGGMMPKANWISFGNTLWWLSPMFPNESLQGAIVGSVTALIFDIWIAVGAQIYGKRPVKLIQNPTSGCFPNNLTVAMNASVVNIYNTTLNTTPYDEVGHISMPSNSQVTSNEGFFLYNISYVWYGFIGFFLTLIIGIFVSLCAGGDRGEPVEAHLIFPIFRKLYGLKSNSTYDLAEMDDKIPPTALSESVENIPYTTFEYHNERSTFSQSTGENASAFHL